MLDEKGNGHAMYHAVQYQNMHNITQPEGEGTIHDEGAKTKSTKFASEETEAKDTGDVGGGDSVGGGLYQRKVISRCRITRRHKHKGKKGRRRTRRHQSS